MPQSNDPTIRIKATSTRSDGGSSQRSLEGFRRRRWLPILGASLLLSGVVAISWGAWHFLSSNSKVDDVDSIADLEGFDEVLSTPDPAKVNESPRDRLGAPRLDDTATTSNTMIALPELPAGLFPMTSSATSAEVWLTGTIEEADPLEKTESTPRLSDVPNEPLILR